MPLQFIASGMLVFNTAVVTSVGVVTPTTIPLYRDIKAMRKLKEADDIILSLISDDASAVAFSGDIHLWFKE